MADMRIVGWNKAAAVVTSDTVDLAPAPCQALYIGGAGNVTLLTEDGTSVLFTAPPVGSILPIKAKRIMATGTTATLMVALWQV